MHAFLGDKETHKRLMEQRKLDGTLFTWCHPLVPCLIRSSLSPSEPPPVKPKPQRTCLQMLCCQSAVSAQKKAAKQSRKQRKKKNKTLTAKERRAQREAEVQEARLMVSESKGRRGKRRYVGEPDSIRVQFPRRTDHISEIAKTQPEGYTSPTIRGVLRAPLPPERDAIKRSEVWPKWGYRHWLKRRRPAMPHVNIKLNSALEMAKRRIEAMRLNTLYHVTLPEELEEQTRAAGRE